MADDKGSDDKNSRDSENDGLEKMLPGMDEDRPLDSLMPEMREGGAPAGAGQGAPEQAEPLHPRVLEVGLEEGTEWNLACWQDPGPRAFHDQLSRMLRATLLRELSRPAARLEERDKSFIGLRLMDFAGLDDDTREVLEGVGFHRESYTADEYSERMSAWREEGRAAGLNLKTAPESLWALPLEQRDGREGRALGRVAEGMRQAMGGQVWGETPGAVSRHLARLLGEELDVEIELGDSGLQTLQKTLFAEATGAVRWTDPMLFQGVCDFVGVVLHGEYGVRVQWGVCEANAHGIVPPPMFRLPRDGHNQTIPVGARVLEWCMLPIAADETASRLDERVGELARLLK